MNVNSVTQVLGISVSDQYLEMKPVYIVYSTLYDNDRLPLMTIWNEVSKEEYEKAEKEEGSSFCGEILYRLKENISKEESQ